MKVGIVFGSPDAMRKSLIRNHFNAGSLVSSLDIYTVLVFVLKSTMVRPVERKKKSISITICEGHNINWNYVKLIHKSSIILKGISLLIRATLLRLLDLGSSDIWHGGSCPQNYQQDRLLQISGYFRDCPSSDVSQSPFP